MMLDHSLRGANILSDICIALFFLRFWQEKGDMLFLFFAIAFFLMALSNLTVAIIGNAGEFAPFAYCLRLAAFLVIIFAIAYKNRPDGRN